MGWNASSSFDGFALYEVEMVSSELEAAKSTAIAALDALSPIGDGVFCYSQSSIDAAKKAINDATSVEEVNAVEAPKPNAPVEGQAYAIANTTANGNLCVANSNVSVTSEAYLFFTAVEGGYILSNSENEYVFKTTSNNWTLSSTTEAAEAYVLTFNAVEGGYTIQGAKGLLGTDSTDDGSAVYADKNASKNGIWTITEYTIPDAISSVNTNETNASVKKVLRDGKIVILKDGKNYNVVGARIK
jgi:hypothetical protein